MPVPVRLPDAVALGALAPPAGTTVAEVGQPSPTPSPAPGGGLESWEVSPGLLGFVPVFLIALACVGLFLSLTRHLRRVTVRQAMLDAEDEAARSVDGGGSGDGTDGLPGDRPSGR
jgi:hypothetical protein